MKQFAVNSAITEPFCSHTSLQNVNMHVLKVLICVIYQWDPPNAGEINGRNRGYTVEMRQGGVLVRSLDVDSDPTNLEGRQQWFIYQLSKYTEYTITVACKTTAGLGPYSAAVSVRTLEDGQ
jgi:hypothetical protein